MIFIIADDLTGANDSGIQLKKNNFNTYVAISQKYFNNLELTNYDVVAINTDSRALSPEASYEVVTKTIKDLQKKFPDALYYKKIDSLYRGNTVKEVEACMKGGKFDRAFIASAYPEGGRVVQNGKVQYSNKEINIYELFKKDSDCKTINIPLDKIRRGKKGLLEYISSLEKYNYSFYLFDGETNEDLAIIYDVFKQKDNSLLCGTAGMAGQINVSHDSNIQNKTFTNAKGSLLFAIGTQNEATAWQVRKLMENNPHITIGILNAENIKKGMVEEERQRVLNQMLMNNNDEWLVVLDSLFEQNTFNLKVSDEMDKLGKVICELLGSLAIEINKHSPIGKIIATGGDTSLGIGLSFKTDGIILQDEILPGVPYGKLVGGALDGALIATKSGAFGNENALIEIENYFCVEKMEEKRI
jgi:uncharacterized protein YgbK (DUF1537 family)